jgi:hypothetical protein
VIGVGTLRYDQAASHDSDVGIGQMLDWVAVMLVRLSPACLPL